mmetsp:Transcript_11055/g.51184  ORF Transcript_11055/g.51184 Transcript_11055/m.51184 type:complete len:277 (+) Transcript_11055:10344-11174(+)
MNDRGFPSPRLRKCGGFESRSAASAASLHFSPRPVSTELPNAYRSACGFLAGARLVPPALSCVLAGKPSAVRSSDVDAIGGLSIVEASSRRRSFSSFSSSSSSTAAVSPSTRRCSPTRVDGSIGDQSRSSSARIAVSRGLTAATRVGPAAVRDSGWDSGDSLSDSDSSPVAVAGLGGNLTRRSLASSPPRTRRRNARMSWTRVSLAVRVACMSDHSLATSRFTSLPRFSSSSSTSSSSRRVLDGEGVASSSPRPRAGGSRSKDDSPSVSSSSTGPP